MLMTNLSIIARGGQVFSTRKLSELNLNAGEQYILMYLMGNEESNQDSIANFFKLDKGTIARTLSKLEAKGFVVRRVNDENQREKVISLTDKAYELKGVLNSQRVELREIMYEGISEEEIKNFESIVEKIAANISNNL